MSVLDTGSPVFSLALSSTLGQCQSSRSASGASFPSDLRLAAASLIDSGDPKNSNHIDVFGTPGPEHEDVSKVRLLARANVSFPCTKVGFAPLSLKQTYSRGEEMLATSSDALRLWDLIEAEAPGSGFVGRKGSSPQWQLINKSEFGRVSRSCCNIYLPSILLPSDTMCAQQAPQPGEFSAPLTSFSWSPIEPSSILTASTNTTVTLYDIGTGAATTQLIAHDKAVYDVQWCPGPAAGRDQFASCGADGSVRMFDIRALEHSTILYETPSSSTSSSQTANGTVKENNPLLRLAFDPNNLHCLAVLHADCNSILMIDNRKPGIPVVELSAHQGPINGMAWSGNNGDTGSVQSSPENQGAIATVGDDGMGAFPS